MQTAAAVACRANRAFSVLVVDLADNLDVMVDEIDLVAGADFLALTGLDFAVNAYQALFDGLLGVTAAICQSLELQNLVELDKIMLKI